MFALIQLLYRYVSLKSFIDIYLVNCIVDPEFTPPIGFFRFVRFSSLFRLCPGGTYIFGTCGQWKSEFGTRLEVGGGGGGFFLFLEGNEANGVDTEVFSVDGEYQEQDKRARCRTMSILITQNCLCSHKCIPVEKTPDLWQ